MSDFGEFLSDCGIDDVFALVDFLSSLPEDPEMMSSELGEEEYERFNEDLERVFKNIW